MRSIVIAFIFLITGPAFAVTVTFDDVPQNYSCEVESDGFLFSLSGMCADPNPGYLSVTTYQDTTIEMTALTGQTFSLDSFDYAGSPLTVTGFYASGGTVQADFFADTLPIDTYSLDASWSNFSKVEFFAPGIPFGIVLDNIVVTTVPIPAGFWLLGSALAGLGWLRRKLAN